MLSLSSQIAHTSQQDHSPTLQNKLITIKTRSTIHGKKEVTINKEKREQNHSPPTSNFRDPIMPPFEIFEQFLLSLLSPKLLEIPFSLTTSFLSRDRSSLASSLPLADSSRGRAHAFLIKSGSPTPHVLPLVFGGHDHLSLSPSVGSGCCALGLSFSVRHELSLGTDRRAEPCSGMASNMIV